MTPLANQVAQLLYPLTDFYTSAGQIVPHIEPLDPQDMPQPYRDLLVHDGDMTPTLENFAADTLHLNCLQGLEENGALFRQVLLITDHDNHILEFGAIKIYLDRFPPTPRQLIREAHIPLGRIMADYNLTHVSRPKGYFAFISDRHIGQAFGLTQRLGLYGRHNVIYDTEDKPMAEVVEILPPLCQTTIQKKSKTKPTDTSIVR